MMWSEAKATARSSPRSSSSWRSGNVGYGLILGFLLVLLYLIVSAQFSYNPHDAAYAGGATTINAKRQRSPDEQDVGERGMEEERPVSEVAGAHTEPSMTVRLKEEREEGEQEWADKNPIEEQSVLGNERNSDNWKETQKPKEKDTVEFTEFGGGTDDFNNVAHAKPICDTSFGKYDICELADDVWARGGAAATVTLVSASAAAGVDDQALLAEVPGRPEVRHGEVRPQPGLRAAVHHADERPGDGDRARRAHGKLLARLHRRAHPAVHRRAAVQRGGPAPRGQPAALLGRQVQEDLQPGYAPRDRRLRQGRRRRGPVLPARRCRLRQPEGVHHRPGHGRHRRRLHHGGLHQVLETSLLLAPPPAD